MLAGVLNPYTHAAQQTGPFVPVRQELTRRLMWTFSPEGPSPTRTVPPPVWRSAPSRGSVSYPAGAFKVRSIGVSRRGGAGDTDALAPAVGVDRRFEFAMVEMGTRVPVTGGA